MKASILKHTKYHKKRFVKVRQILLYIILVKEYNDMEQISCIPCLNEHKESCLVFLPSKRDEDVDGC